MSKKRGALGQVTIFIIFAIILLLVAGLVFYIQKRNSEINPIIDKLPSEAMPVGNFIEGCINKIGTEAVLKLGTHSGYLYVPDEIKDNPKHHLKLSQGMILPYWYYGYESHPPTTEFIQNQISYYVEHNLDNCLNDFSSFKGRFDIKKTGKLNVQTEINENNVIITLNYPLTIKSSKAQTEAKMFSSKVQVRLGRILKLSRQILNAENREAWLEHKTIDIMATNKDIPFTSLTFSCTPLIWQVSQIENLTKKMLYSDLPLIRVKNTKYRPFLEKEAAYTNPSSNPPEDMVEYSMFFWKPLKESYNDLRIGFTYNPSWDMLFKANPSSGGIMKTERMRGGRGAGINLASYCLQLNHFNYDITYPVEVSIFDEKSLAKGYMFNFAFPVTIFGNWAVRNSKVPEEVSILENQDFCSQTGDKDYVIWVRDSQTYSDLDNVSISYNCIKYDCQLGTTDSTGKITVKLPSSCKNGFIVANKDDYLQSAKQTTDQTSVILEMKPLKELSLHVTKYDNETQATSELVSGEKAVIYLNSKKNNQEVYKVYENGDETVKLADGLYDLEVYLYSAKTLKGGYTGKIEIPKTIYQKSNINLQVLIWPDKNQEDIFQAINDKYNSTEIKPVFS